MRGGTRIDLIRGGMMALVLAGLCSLPAQATIVTIDDFSSPWTTTSTAPGGPYTLSRVLDAATDDAVATFTTENATFPGILHYSFAATTNLTVQETILRGGYSFVGTNVGDYVQVRAKLGEGTIIGNQGMVGGLVLSTDTLTPTDRTKLYRVQVDARQRFYVEMGSGSQNFTDTNVALDQWVTLRLIRVSPNTIRAAYSLDTDGEGDIDEPFVYIGAPAVVSDFVGVGIVNGNMRVTDNPGTMLYDDLIMTQGEALPPGLLTMSAASYTFAAPVSKEVALGISGPPAGPGGVPVTLTYDPAILAVKTADDTPIASGDTVYVPEGLNQVAIDVQFVGTATGQSSTLLATSAGYADVSGLFQAQFPPLTMTPTAYVFSPGNVGPQDVTIAMPTGVTGPASIGLTYSEAAIAVTAADNTPIPSGGTIAVGAGQTQVVVKVTFVGQPGQSSKLTAALAPFTSVAATFRMPPTTSPFYIDDFSSDWVSTTTTPGGPYTQSRVLGLANPTATFTTMDAGFPDEVHYSFIDGFDTSAKQDVLLLGGYSFAGTMENDYVQVRAKFSTGTNLGASGMTGGIVLCTNTLAPTDRNNLFRISIESRRRIYAEPGTNVTDNNIALNRWVALRLTRVSATTIQAAYSVDVNDDGLINDGAFINVGNPMTVSDFVGVGLLAGNMSSTHAGTIIFDDLIMTSGEQPKLPLTMTPPSYTFTAPGSADVTLGLSGTPAGPGGVPLTLAYDDAVIAVTLPDNTPIANGADVLVPEGQSQVAVKVNYIGLSGTSSTLSASHPDYVSVLGTFSSQFPKLVLAPDAYLFTYPGNMDVQNVTLGLPNAVAGPGGAPIALTYNPAVISVTSANGTPVPTGSNVIVPEAASTVGLKVAFVGKLGESSLLTAFHPEYAVAKGPFQAYADPYVTLVDGFKDDWTTTLAVPSGPYTQSVVNQPDPSDIVTTLTTVAPGYPDQLHFSFTGTTTATYRQDTLLRGGYSFAATTPGDYVQVRVRFTENTIMGQSGMIGGVVLCTAPTLAPTDRTMLYRVQVDARQRIYVEAGTGPGGGPATNTILTTATNPDLAEVIANRWVTLRLMRTGPTSLQASYSIDTDDEGDYDEPFVDAAAPMELSDFTGLGVIVGNMLLNNVGTMTFDDLLFFQRCGSPRFDADHDGDVDQSDFGLWQACYTSLFAVEGLPMSLCKCFDVNNDDRVDPTELAAFLNCAATSGPGVPADPACDDSVGQ